MLSFDAKGYQNTFGIILKIHLYGFKLDSRAIQRLH